MSLTPNDLCHCTLPICRKALPEVNVTAWPWNMYEPDVSPWWWLVPSTEWPAYRWAKFVFTRQPDEPDSLDIGLHIEKGLDPSVREAYPSAKGSRFIMERDWAWFSLLKPEADARLVGLADAVGSAIPLRIRVEAAYVSDPGSFDPQRPKPSRYQFRSDRIGRLVQEQAEDPHRHLTPALRSVRSMAELHNGLQMLQSNGWLWIDLTLFAAYGGEDMSCEDLAWRAWGEVLAHMADWFSP
jgi:hypothetical protein